MVIGVSYVEQSNPTVNAPNARVLYEVVILGGTRSGQILTQVRAASELGGLDNFAETIFQPSSKDLTETPLQDHDGDIVFVSFIQGDQNYAVIIAADVGLNTTQRIGATSEDGIREIRQFNGFKIEVNKSGEYFLTRQGGTNVEGVFKPSEDEPEYRLENINGEKVTETFKSGLKIEKDGIADKVVVTSKEGAVVTIDGPGGVITLTHGNTTITIDSQGRISLTGEMVDLGAAVSDLVLLGLQTITAHNTHFHLQPALPGSPPTTPPTAPMPTSVMSTSVAVQS